MNNKVSSQQDGLDPARLFPPMMLFAPPVGLWRTANGMRIEEGATARIVEAADAEKPMGVSLLRYRAKQLESVALEWSAPQGRLVSDAPIETATALLPPELIVLIRPNSGEA